MATKTGSAVKHPAITQAEKRRGIDVGPGLTQVSTAAYWYQGGQFMNDDEARGAFRLAYQQGLDGMGTSIAEWMGLTDEQYHAWMREDALPKRKK
jgi:hypothetical protein